MPKIVDHISNVESKDAVVALSGRLADLYGTRLVGSAPAVPVNVKLNLPDLHFWQNDPPPKDTDNFSAIKKAGQIKMTPLHREKHKEEFFKADVTGRRWIWYQPAAAYVDDQGRNQVWCGPLVESSSKWNVAWTLDLLRSRGVPEYGLDVSTQSEISKAMNEVRASAVQEAYDGFDALTTLAELKESLELIKDALSAVRNPLKTALAALKSGRKDLLGDLSSKWLLYRYGIMPLILTVQDAIKVLQEREYLFTRVAKRQDVRFDEMSGPLLNKPDLYIYHKIEGTSIVRAVIKTRYETSNLRLADLIGFNPLNTAWELVTLSFVVDWFINVGDVIAGISADIGDLASERVHCSSQRTTLTHSVWVKADIIDKSSTTIDTFSYQGQVVRQGQTYSRENRIRGDFRLFEKKSEIYTRGLFSPDDIELQFNPNLNWRRWLDAFALSLNPIRTGLRKLK